MPLTPFHIGPAATIGLPLKRFIHLPVFILVNFAVDIEPLVVMLFGLKYPQHGLCHTFLIGALAGVVFAAVYVLVRKETHAWKKILVSGVLGAWLHVLLDAPLYSDIRPFYPLQANPLYGLASYEVMYMLCALLFIPAGVMFVRSRASIPPRTF